MNNMCVIAVKPIGVELPTEETLKQMWDANKDGAGFMYNLDGKVIIKKGFMTFDALKDALNETYRDLTNRAINAQDTAFVYHFRIATHGTVSPQNTHPFPVTNNLGMLKATHIETDLGMAHNGIIHNVDVAAEEDLTDTAVFVRDVVTPFKEFSGMVFLNNKNTVKALGAVAGYSRLAFLDGSGNIVKIGSWSEGADKICYSNLNHVPRKTYTYTPTTRYKSTSTGDKPTTYDITLKGYKWLPIDLRKYLVSFKTQFNDADSEDMWYSQHKYYVSDTGKILLRFSNGDLFTDSKVKYVTATTDFTIQNKVTKVKLSTYDGISDSGTYVEKLQVDHAYGIDATLYTKETATANEKAYRINLKKVKEVPPFTYQLVNVKNGKITPINYRRAIYITPYGGVYYRKSERDTQLTADFIYLGILGVSYDLQFIITQDTVDYDNLVNYSAEKDEIYPISKTKDFNNVTVVHNK